MNNRTRNRALEEETMRQESVDATTDAKPTTATPGPERPVSPATEPRRGRGGPLRRIIVI